MNQLNVHILHFKAVVRAIDTVQDVAMKLANVVVNRFMVSGASKVCIVFILKITIVMSILKPINEGLDGGGGLVFTIH